MVTIRLVLRSTNRLSNYDCYFKCNSYFARRVSGAFHRVRYLYTYKREPRGPPKGAQKRVPVSPGPGGTTIAKTLEFVMREQKNLGAGTPVFGQFRGVHFEVDFGPPWGHFWAPFGFRFGPQVAPLGFFRCPFWDRFGAGFEHTRRLILMNRLESIL